MALPENTTLLSILVVEDNPGDLFLLEENLRQTRLPLDKVYTATSATGAIAILETQEIDVVLLDLSLPDSFGFNSFTQLHKHASAIPIIVLTGLADTEMALETMASGAQDYLIKGEFDERLLAKSIQYSIERNRTRLSLMESNESYRNLFFNNPLPIIIWDTATLQVLEVNDMSQQVYGYTRDQLLRMNMLDFREEQFYDQFTLFAKEFNENVVIQKSSIWEHKKKSGEKLILDISHHKIDYKGVSAILAIHNDITQKVRLEEKLEEEQALKEKEIAQARIQEQEKERSEISSELHDNVNQQLTVAMMYIASAQQKYPNDNDTLKQSSKLILIAIEEIRKLSQILVTPMIKHFGLSKAIEGLLDDVSVVNTILFDLTADAFYEEDIKYEFKLNIFRIVQEQISNIIKHAKASNVFIELVRNDQLIFLKIQDDGVGFDINQKRKGIGLYNITVRADLYDGLVDIQSTPGKGSAIYITIPLKESILIKE